MTSRNPGHAGGAHWHSKSNVPLFGHKFQLKFELEKYLKLKIWTQSVQMDSEASSQSFDSGPEGLGIKSRENQAKKQPVQGMEFSTYPQHRFFG